MKTELTIEIATSPEALWPYVCEHDKLLLWMVDLRESRQVTPGHPALGAEFRQVFRQRVVDVPVVGRVTTFEPPTRFAYHATIAPLLPVSPPMEIDGRWVLTPADEGTVLHYVEETTVASPWFGLVSLLLQARVDARHRHAFGNLKRLIETGSAL